MRDNKRSVQPIIKRVRLLHFKNERLLPIIVRFVTNKKITGHHRLWEKKKRSIPNRISRYPLKFPQCVSQIFDGEAFIPPVWLSAISETRLTGLWGMSYVYVFLFRSWILFLFHQAILLFFLLFAAFVPFCKGRNFSCLSDCVEVKMKWIICQT